MNRVESSIRTSHNFHFSDPLSLVSKIKVDKPIAELDGDEMTRIIWHKIRQEVRFAAERPNSYFPCLPSQDDLLAVSLFIFLMANLLTISFLYSLSYLILI